ncbi:Uncharacterised protein [Mycobacteroides abscessus]|nr:Uncharacterised protein [Mycobacteroides abscessus]CPZ87784.1 Uncharacterised protein [Mycobacteroides abscessus]SKW62839.1 Uncharacterised protein [Mycobacteroides abscessus subsp. abscessus]
MLGKFGVEEVVGISMDHEHRASVFRLYFGPHQCGGNYTFAIRVNAQVNGLSKVAIEDIGFPCHGHSLVEGIAGIPAR